MIFRVFAALLLAPLCLGLLLEGEQLMRAFEDYKKDYKRAYSTHEERHRFHCFVRNLHVIEELNANYSQTEFGIGVFTDLCPEEFAERYLTARPLSPQQQEEAERESARLSPLPEPAAQPGNVGVISGFDWRNSNNGLYMPPIQDQKSCGSCWAFAAVAAMEAAWNRKYKTSVKLSEEYITQCDHSQSSQRGCNGGWPYYAIKYAISSKGVPSAAAYPYVYPYGGSCTTVASKLVKTAKFTNVLTLVGAQKTESMIGLAYIRTIGPMYILVDATYWSNWKSGIYTACSNKNINHAVALVGIGVTDGNVNYWIIRNSWGTSWGPNNGYMYMAYGQNCNGFLTELGYAIV